MPCVVSFVSLQNYVQRTKQKVGITWPYCLVQSVRKPTRVPMSALPLCELEPLPSLSRLSVSLNVCRVVGRIKHNYVHNCLTELLEHSK